MPEGALDQAGTDRRGSSYEDVRIEGFDKLVEAVRSVAPRCKIVAQVSSDYPGVGPSDVSSPFTRERTRVLSREEIHAIVGCFVEAIDGLRQDGFDGVQLHAAHGDPGQRAASAPSTSPARRVDSGDRERHRSCGDSTRCCGEPPADLDPLATFRSLSTSW